MRMLQAGTDSEFYLFIHVINVGVKYKKTALKQLEKFCSIFSDFQTLVFFFHPPNT